MRNSLAAELKEVLRGKADPRWQLDADSWNGTSVPECEAGSGQQGAQQRPGAEPAGLPPTGHAAISELHPSAREEIKRASEFRTALASVEGHIPIGGRMFVSKTEVMQLFGISRSTVYRWVAQGRLPDLVAPTGGTKRFLAVELMERLEQWKEARKPKKR
jgi:predicted DNA-binding transcriptional regulator AlpA